MADRADVISRVVCAGVTRSTAPVAASSFISAVARMRSCRGTSGRKRALLRVAASAAACSGERIHSTTSLPAMAAALASAVPQAPAPAMPMV